MCKYIKSKVKKGFTLIELMVSMAILLLIISSTYMLFSAGRVFWFSQNAAIEVQSEARRALDYIAIELLSAINIDPLNTNPVSSIGFQIPVYCDGVYSMLGNPGGDGFWVDIGTAEYYVESTVGSAGLDAGAYLLTDFDIDPMTNRMRIASADSSRRGRRIIYSLGGMDNSQLIRTVSSPGGVQLESTVLANNVTGLRFQKRNVFGGLAMERRIIIIEIDIRKNVFPGWSAAGDEINALTLSTRVALRN
jgi:prepilin-type N-terminal cleavage/methylation domain-containing protein